MTATRRVFFALWPTRRVRDRIATRAREAIAQAGGRAVSPANYHITLAFLGAVDAAGLERAAAVVPVHTGPVELVLDTLGGFGRAGVFWLAPSQVPPSLEALENVLWRRLAGAGFRREARAFRPHLTLARKARPVPGSLGPIRWRATRLALVESVSAAGGVRYRPLGFWSLGRSILSAMA